MNNYQVTKLVEAKHKPAELTKDLRVRNRRRDRHLTRVKSEAGCDMRHIIFATIKRMYSERKCQIRRALNRLVRETLNNRTECGLKDLLNFVLEGLREHEAQHSSENDKLLPSISCEFKKVID